MLKRIVFSTIVTLAGLFAAKAQNSVLDAGLRLQRDIGLYSENGIALNYSDRRLLPDRLYFGFNYFSSRFGTALNSNAIKQDNFLISPAYYFRHGHVIRPFARINAGYFSADYPALFAMLPHSSFLLSTEAGVSFQTRTPFKIATSIGYNAIYGQGNNNVPGTLYPLFFQITLSWDILKHKK